MRRLLATLTIIVCLSFPALGGHVLGSGFSSCECGTPGCIEDYPGECDGHRATSQQSTSSDLGSESLLILAALMLWLRLKP